MHTPVLRPLATMGTVKKTIREDCRSAVPQGLVSGNTGSTMIEVLVALALVGATVVCFLAALTTVSTSTVAADTRSTADSLAASQMEYILAQAYDGTTTPLQYALLSDVPDGWSVGVVAERLDPEDDGTDDDDGIQEIAVTVSLRGTQVVALTSRKVNPAYVP